MPSEANNLSVPENQLLKLTNSDKRRIEKLSKRVLFLEENVVFDEVYFNFKGSGLIERNFLGN